MAQALLLPVSDQKLNDEETLMKSIYFSVLAALMVAPNLSLAQGANIDAEVDQELDQMYANKQAGSAVATPAPVSGSVAGTANHGAQPIYILNQATPTSNANAQTQTSQVQKQPVAIIESTPLVESRAEVMRKSRQDAEIQTEQKIVEKLEQSRLEDEKRRAELLFGNKLEQTNSNVTVVSTQPAPAQPIVVQPVEPKENLRDIVRDELRAKVAEEVVEKRRSAYYFSGLAGVSDYPDVANVRGNYSFGAAMGTKFDSLVVEGSFLFSNYEIEQVDATYNPYYPKLIDADQYQGAIAAKYQLMSGMVRPVLGGLTSYSYRKYTWRDVVYMGQPYKGSSSDSHALDLGVTAGVDLEFNKNFALGFEYRYMFNLTSRVNNQPVFTSGLQSSGGTPIEKLNYYTVAIAAKVNF